MGTRDWSHLSEPESQLPDRRPPEPLFASAASPEFPLGPTLKALPERQAPTLPRKARVGKYRGSARGRKCRCFFGLAHFIVHGVWTLTRISASRCGDHPHHVER